MIDFRDYAYNGTGNEDDSAVVTQALNEAEASGFGGETVLLPAGLFAVPQGISFRRGMKVKGAGLSTTMFLSGDQNIRLVDFAGIDAADPSAACNHAGMEDFSVIGCMHGGAAHDTVRIGHNALVNLNRVKIVGGYNALFNAGVDCFISDCWIASKLNANIVSIGSNNYHRLRCMLVGDPNDYATYGFYQSVTFAGPVMSVNQFSQSDFTGNFGVASVCINDGAHKGVLNFSQCEMGGPRVKIDNALHVAFTMCQLGSEIVNPSGSYLDVLGCHAPAAHCTIYSPAAVTNISAMRNMSYVPI